MCNSSWSSMHFNLINYLLALSIQTVLVLFQLSANGINAIITFYSFSPFSSNSSAVPPDSNSTQPSSFQSLSNLPPVNATVRMGLWQICSKNFATADETRVDDEDYVQDLSYSSDWNCHVVLSVTQCESFCSELNLGRCLVLGNIFFSLGLAGLFCNKIGVKRWRTGEVGVLHCVWFSLLQILFNLITCCYLLFLFHLVKERREGREGVVRVQLGVSFILPSVALFLSLFVLIFPLRELCCHSKVKAQEDADNSAMPLPVNAENVASDMPEVNCSNLENNGDASRPINQNKSSDSLA